MRQRVVMSWSGGKDSALALHQVLRDPQCDVAALLTHVNAAQERVSMHGVRTELLAAQAQRLGLPLRQLRLPAETPSMADYEQALAAVLTEARAQDVAEVVYGDIFLADLRAYREQQLARAGLRGRFPLWQRAGADLLREFLDAGFQAIIVCVHAQRLDASFCGRLLDRDLLRDLPPSVDPCGENGEYHSFVFDSPDFSAPIAVVRGAVEYRSSAPATARLASPRGAGSPFAASFWYCDLLPG